MGQVTFSPIQQGCICPPGTERTCEGPLCPRRNVSRAGVWTQAGVQPTLDHSGYVRGAFANSDPAELISYIDAFGAEASKLMCQCRDVLVKLTETP